MKLSPSALFDQVERPIKIVVAVSIAVALVVAVAVGVVTSGAGPDMAWRAAGDPATTSSVTPAALPCGGWDCALEARFAATAALVARKPGQLGLVVRDRTTNLVWRAGTATHEVWTASTIKLAIIADLLVRARAGEVTITDSMRAGFGDMLNYSANRPASNLWSAHGGPAAIERYQTVFGMKGVHFPTSERVWGAIKCTAEDLAALMSYVLDKMHPEDRAYLIGQMRNVHEVQRWGVWAAGSAMKPGVKDGWNVELNADGERGWVMNSVGFAGPNQRYAVAIMYELEPGTHVRGNTAEDGLHAVSDAIATLFGAKVPAKVPPVSLLVNPPGTPTDPPTS